jgi:penicillin-binding protein activator
MNKTSMAMLGGLLAALGLGCSGPVTTYGNAQATETVNADFGSTDLQIIADKMVASLISSNRLQPDPADPGKPPLVSVTRLRNETSEHIDTKSITDKIRTALIKSGKVRFSALEMQGELMQQYKLQGVMADTDTAKAPGKQLGAKYILGGDISSIVKQAGKVKDVYYKITLQCTDIESAVIEWADEVEIRKDQVRRLFGS